MIRTRIYFAFVLFVLGSVTSLASNALSGCKDRCFARFNSSRSCQCNSVCTYKGDCCDDYKELCDSSAMCATECRMYLPDVNQCQNCSYRNGGCMSESVLLNFTGRLWDLNLYKPNASDFVINKQGNTTRKGNTDEAPEKLFTWVNEDIFKHPSFAILISLLDKYEPSQGKAEVNSYSKRKAQNKFLNYFLATPIGKALRRFLHKHGLSGCGRISHFKKVLRRVWFHTYGRRATDIKDSSGFEHVFVGEFRENSPHVTGFHNWVQYYLNEKAGRINYRGYLGTPDDISPVQKPVIQFEWDGRLKEITSIMVGLTPEWEFAVYTLCYLASPGFRCPILYKDFDGSFHEGNVLSFKWTKVEAVNGVSHLSSSYVA